jgi:5-hydroxyisourate hydrolase
MSAITTHVLDAVLGKPAAGISVHLEKQSDTGWITIAESLTDEDGRCRGFALVDSAATYRFRFAVGEYFAIHNRLSLYPEIAITFIVDGQQNYHIPLLLSDNSFTTYRGS